MAVANLSEYRIKREMRTHAKALKSRIGHVEDEAHEEDEVVISQEGMKRSFLRESGEGLQSG